MKEDKYQVSLDDNEHGIVIRCLMIKEMNLSKKANIPMPLMICLLKWEMLPKRKQG